MRSIRLEPLARGTFVMASLACSMARSACMTASAAWSMARRVVVSTVSPMTRNLCATTRSGLMVARASEMARTGLAMARIGAAATLSARAVMLGRTLFYLLVMTILTKFWNAVAAEHAGGSLNLPSGIVLYVGIAEWITLSVPAIHLRLEDDIRSGAIEAHLLRPMPYLFGRIGETVGEMIVRLGVLGLGGAIVLLIFGRSDLLPAAWPLIVVAAVLGGAVQVMLIAITGLSTFWVRRSLAAYLIMQKLIFLLGGLFAPVTLYPAWLARIALCSPFAASLYWPAVIVLEPDPRTILSAFVAVVFWMAMLAWVCGCIWRAGVQRLLTRGI